MTATADQATGDNAIGREAGGSAIASIGSGSTATGRNSGLDLIRGVAVGLVLLRHAWPSVFPGAGVVGVVMFFALSGYLITGLLLDELQTTGRLRLGRFYRRRVRRLVPPLLAMLTVLILVTLVWDPIGDRDQLPRTLLFALTWTGDLPFGHASPATFHLWTLALEEQFYLFWPAVLWFGHRWGRRRRAATGRLFGSLPGAVLLVSGAICVLLSVATMIWLHRDPDLAYSLPTPWAGCFVIGAAARAGRGRLLRIGPRTAPYAVVLLAVLALLPLRGQLLTYLVGGPMIAILTILVIGGWQRLRIRGPGRALVGLGLISYGSYLWDYPLTLWFRSIWPSSLWPQLLAGPAAAVAAVGAATMSWYAIERRRGTVRAR